MYLAVTTTKVETRSLDIYDQNGKGSCRSPLETREFSCFSYKRSKYPCQLGARRVDRHDWPWIRNSGHTWSPWSHFAKAYTLNTIFNGGFESWYQYLCSFARICVPNIDCWFWQWKRATNRLASKYGGYSLVDSTVQVSCKFPLFLVAARSDCLRFCDTNTSWISMPAGGVFERLLFLYQCLDPSLSIQDIEKVRAT